jgi:NAD-reducing hydrogenase large subunit
MPAIMARICGICPISHLLASAKACDAILAVRIPHTAVLLREAVNLAQIVQSHALSFFYLCAPDLLLGLDSDPATRNIFGMLRKNPDIARDGIRLRKFGQQTIERLAGKRIHPTWIVPGGVSRPLAKDTRDQILADIPAALEIAVSTIAWFKRQLGAFADEISAFGNFPSLFLSLTNGKRTLEFYNGMLRFLDSQGTVLAAALDPATYAEYIGEAVSPDSYQKAPYYLPLGIPDGMYRVGPLARINIARNCGTPRADAALAELRELSPTPTVSSFHYHYARLIEIIHALERLQSVLREADVLSDHVRAFAGPNESEGVGVTEAPRGTLIHHYKADRNGTIQWANLIVATGHNNLAMNRGILQAARIYVHGDKLNEGMLNRVEAVIRAFDPCLSCSTHAAGEMALRIELRGPDGSLLDSIVRN